MKVLKIRYDRSNFRCCIWFACFFLQFKERITENYPELFSNSEGDRASSASAGFSAKWGWYQSIYGLTNGDILKYNEITKSKLHTCLMHLAFEKDKYELEQQILKRNQR